DVGVRKHRHATHLRAGGDLRRKRALAGAVGGAAPAIRSSESGCRRRESGWREGLGKKDAGAGGYGVSGKVTEEPVVGEEEEEFIFLDGPADSETKHIPIILRFER